MIVLAKWTEIERSKRLGLVKGCESKYGDTDTDIKLDECSRTIRRSGNLWATIL